MYSTRFLVPCILLYGGANWAQGTPGTNLSVTVQVVGIAMHGDTTTISFFVANAPSSSEELFDFSVDAPSPVTSINLPSPSERWKNSTRVKGLTVASWTMLGTHLPHGSQTPELRYSAIGLPGVVGYWAQGRFPVPEYHPVTLSDTVPTPREAIAANRISGVSVGVEPFPSDRSAAALSLRLRGLTGQACDSLHWIGETEVCSDLTAVLDSATQALGQSDTATARSNLLNFLVVVAAHHDTGGSLNDNAFWLLSANADFIVQSLNSSPASLVFLHGSGGTGNPPTLSLSTDAPTGTTAKYQDSPSINFNGGNPWATVGTWTAAPSLANGSLTALGDAHVWLGLKNSDDVGTNFDVRVEAWKNGTLVTAGETRCIQGLTRNANDAQEVPVPFMSFSPAPFNGTSDVLSLKVLTRVGTTETGASCGGHQNAVGLRLYFDATNRAAQLTTTF
jgi:hypothetical protein